MQWFEKFVFPRATCHVRCFCDQLQQLSHSSVACSSCHSRNKESLYWLIALSVLPRWTAYTCWSIFYHVQIPAKMIRWFTCLGLSFQQPRTQTPSESDRVRWKPWKSMTALLVFCDDNTVNKRTVTTPSKLAKLNSNTYPLACLYSSLRKASWIWKALVIHHFQKRKNETGKHLHGYGKRQSLALCYTTDWKTITTHVEKL